jgi:hypothetical protein
VFYPGRAAVFVFTKHFSDSIQWKLIATAPLGTGTSGHLTVWDGPDRVTLTPNITDSGGNLIVAEPLSSTQSRAIGSAKILTLQTTGFNNSLTQPNPEFVPLDTATSGQNCVLAGLYPAPVPGTTVPPAGSLVCELYWIGTGGATCTVQHNSFNILDLGGNDVVLNPGDSIIMVYADSVTFSTTIPWKAIAKPGAAAPSLSHRP